LLKENKYKQNSETKYQIRTFVWRAIVFYNQKFSIQSKGSFIRSRDVELV